RYSTFIKNYGANQVYKIAAGPNVDDTTWTDVVMRKTGDVINGIALHYYTSNSKPAAVIDEKGWFDVIRKTLRMDEIISMHTKVMDRHDPAKKVALIVDEWGTWHSVEPGTNPSFLFQQNTMRDAIVAASNLNIFHKHNDRVKMTNIAQMVNVLQAMILTDKKKMVLTPTYHVFEMYKAHQDAINLPIQLETPNYEFGQEAIPSVNASASITSKGIITISLCNVNPTKNAKVNIKFNSFKNKNISAQILTAEEMNALNSFDAPTKVMPTNFTDFKFTKDELQLDMPAKSVIVFKLDGQIDSRIGKAIEVKKVKPGIKYAYYEGILMVLPDFSEMEVLRKGKIDQITIPEENSLGDYAVRYSGLIKLPADGFYNFYANADDGCKIYIDGKLIVNNDGRHAPIEVKGFASLHKGFHRIVVEFFQAGGGAVLETRIEGPGLAKQIIPANMLFHEID
ncbi:hypothetical protein KC799_12110, partial [candidate division KSB1 bacterium]|nr:hypothetical protein [candidate division KSB1 bacterium]